MGRKALGELAIIPAEHFHLISHITFEKNYRQIKFYIDIESKPKENLVTLLKIKPLIISHNRRR